MGVCRNGVQLRMRKPSWWWPRLRHFNLCACIRSQNLGGMVAENLQYGERERHLNDSGSKHYAIALWKCKHRIMRTIFNRNIILHLLKLHLVTESKFFCTSPYVTSVFLPHYSCSWQVVEIAVDKKSILPSSHSAMRLARNNAVRSCEPSSKRRPSMAWNFHSSPTLSAVYTSARCGRRIHHPCYCSVHAFSATRVAVRLFEACEWCTRSCGQWRWLFGGVDYDRSRRG